MAGRLPIRLKWKRFIATLGFDTSGTFGGHTSCVQLITDRPEHIILDLGSGVRALGQHIFALHGAATPQTYHVFLSHLHWDHIMGLPFFMPAYTPGNRIIVHSGHANARAALRRQQDAPSFPVDFGHMGADFEFVVHTPGVAQTVAGMTVDLMKQRHSGDSYGWRFDRPGRTRCLQHRLGTPCGRCCRTPGLRRVLQKCRRSHF